LQPQTAGATIESVRTEARRLGGKLIVKSAPSDLKLNSWDEPEMALTVMRRLKQELDPLRIFASGPYDFL
jgi:FAD/FMN-containing dehydrogenase